MHVRELSAFLDFSFWVLALIMFIPLHRVVKLFLAMFAQKRFDRANIWAEEAFVRCYILTRRRNSTYCTELIWMRNP